MRYPNTARLLKGQISKLQKVVQERTNEMAEPEMNADLVFAENDIETANNQIKEHQAALVLLEFEGEMAELHELLKTGEFWPTPELITVAWLLDNVKEMRPETKVALMFQGYLNNNGVRYVHQYETKHFHNYLKTPG